MMGGVLKAIDMVIKVKVDQGYSGEFGFNANFQGHGNDFQGGPPGGFNFVPGPGGGEYRGGHNGNFRRPYDHTNKFGQYHGGTNMGRFGGRCRGRFVASSFAEKRCYREGCGQAE
jgi:hypothetical protein